MSVKAMAWAFEQSCDGDPGLKLTLLALCDHADDDGTCWPSQERLQLKAGLSHATINRKLALLVELGLVERQRRGQKTTMYRVTFNKRLESQRETPETSLESQFDVLESHSRDTNHQLEPSTDSDSRESESVATELFSEKELPRKAKRTKRQTMPENWEPDERGVLFARDLGFADRKLQQLVVACRDYHLKHGTLIAGAVGLSATWRTWCNNEVKFSAERNARYGASNRDSRSREEIIYSAVRNATSQMARERDGRRSDAEIFERGDSEADRRGTPQHRIEDQRH